MNSWDLTTLRAEPHAPQILSSTPAARVVVLLLPSGERLQDHEVHERALLIVVSGEVTVTAGDEADVVGGSGGLFEFAPGERSEVTARSDARLLLVLAPWPGAGHPGALSLEQKAEARSHAAEHAQSAARLGP